MSLCNIKSLTILLQKPENDLWHTMKESCEDNCVKECRFNSDLRSGDSLNARTCFLKLDKHNSGNLRFPHKYCAGLVSSMIHSTAGHPEHASNEALQI